MEFLIPELKLPKILFKTAEIQAKIGEISSKLNKFIQVSQQLQQIFPQAKFLRIVNKLKVGKFLGQLGAISVGLSAIQLMIMQAIKGIAAVQKLTEAFFCGNVAAQQTRLQLIVTEFYRILAYCINYPTGFIYCPVLEKQFKNNIYSYEIYFIKPRLHFKGNKIHSINIETIVIKDELTIIKLLRSGIYPILFMQIPSGFYLKESNLSPFGIRKDIRISSVVAGPQELKNWNIAKNNALADLKMGYQAEKEWEVSRFIEDFKKTLGKDYPGIISEASFRVIARIVYDVFCKYGWWRQKDVYNYLRKIYFIAKNKFNWDLTKKSAHVKDAVCKSYRDYERHYSRFFPKRVYIYIGLEFLKLLSSLHPLNIDEKKIKSFFNSACSMAYKELSKINNPYSSFSRYFGAKSETYEQAGPSFCTPYQRPKPYLRLEYDVGFLIYPKNIKSAKNIIHYAKYERKYRDWDFSWQYIVREALWGNYGVRCHADKLNFEKFTIEELKKQGIRVTRNMKPKLLSWKDLLPYTPEGLDEKSLKEFLVAKKMLQQALAMLFEGDVIQSLIQNISNILQKIQKGKYNTILLENLKIYIRRLKGYGFNKLGDTDIDEIIQLVDSLLKKSRIETKEEAACRRAKEIESRIVGIIQTGMWVYPFNINSLKDNLNTFRRVHLSRIKGPLRQQLLSWYEQAIQYVDNLAKVSSSLRTAIKKAVQNYEDYIKKIKPNVNKYDEFKLYDILNSRINNFIALINSIYKKEYSGFLAMLAQLFLKPKYFVIEQFGFVKPRIEEILRILNKEKSFLLNIISTKIAPKRNKIYSEAIKMLKTPGNYTLSQLVNMLNLLVTSNNFAKAIKLDARKYKTKSIKDFENLISKIQKLIKDIKNVPLLINTISNEIEQIKKKPAMDKIQKIEKDVKDFYSKYKNYEKLLGINIEEIVKNWNNTLSFLKVKSKIIESMKNIENKIEQVKKKPTLEEIQRVERDIVSFCDKYKNYSKQFGIDIKSWEQKQMDILNTLKTKLEAPIKKAIIKKEVKEKEVKEERKISNIIPILLLLGVGIYCWQQYS